MGTGKIYLFHNEEISPPPKRFADYLKEPFESVIDQTLIYKTYGNRNTGTYLMTDTLAKIVDADKFITRFYKFEEHVDTVVTNVFHRIGANLKVDFPYWENILDHADRVVPLSLGFAFEGGEIAPLDESLKRLLSMISERIEVGVRTEFDAEYLNAQGFKKVCVIGCPSLFYHMDRDFKVRRKDDAIKSVNFNFTSDFRNLQISQKEAVEVHWKLLLWMKWQYERLPINVHLTMQKQPFAEISDMHDILLSYGEIHPFYKDCGRYFYAVADWVKELKKDDFSMGSRFHGNVAAILAGIPALMVNVDKRMEGMNRFYGIPSIGISEFDLDKPLEYYAELADYTAFNKLYPKRFDNFTDYCKRNGIRLKTNTGGMDGQ